VRCWLGVQLQALNPIYVNFGVPQQDARAPISAWRNLGIEIEALRIAAPLLSDDGDDNSAAPVSTRWAAPTRPFQVPQAANSGPQPEHTPEWKERTVGFP
jgi:hypothetical protein